MSEPRWLELDDLPLEVRDETRKHTSNGHHRPPPAHPWTGAPDAFWDKWAPALGNAELRVLIYLLRRTVGFRKSEDAISISQFSTGIVRKDGERQDYGTSLAERHIRTALTKLQGRGLIGIVDNGQGRGRINVYRINLEVLERGPE